MKGALYALREEQKDDHKHADRQQERSRRRDAAEPRIDAGERQHCRHGYDGNRADRKKRMWLAAERVSSCAQDKDYQNLRGQRLDKPAGLEQSLIRVKDQKKETECQEIEQRADRPENQHEIAHEAHIPMFGARRPVAIDLVKGYRQLRDIVEQVIK